MAGALGRSRLVCSGRWPGRCCPIGGRCPKGGLAPGAPGMPGRGGMARLRTDRLRRQRPWSAKHAWCRRTWRRRVTGSSRSAPGRAAPGRADAPGVAGRAPGWRCRRRLAGRCVAAKPAAASPASAGAPVAAPCRAPRCADESSAARSGPRAPPRLPRLRFRSLGFRLGRRDWALRPARWRDLRRLFDRGGRWWLPPAAVSATGGASRRCLNDRRFPGRRSVPIRRLALRPRRPAESPA